jgi:hypothetical protein
VEIPPHLMPLQFPAFMQRIESKVHTDTELEELFQQVAFVAFTNINSYLSRGG